MVDVFRTLCEPRLPANPVDDTGHQITLDARVSIPVGLTERSLASLVTFVLQHEGVSEDCEIAFRLTSDHDIRQMHCEFMGLDSATDIMTFPYQGAGEQIPDGAPGMVGGDIVISVEQASAQAANAGWSTLDELRFLVIHGVLHLVGWDDHDEKARQAMLKRQGDLLKMWQARNDLAVGAS